MPRGPAVLLYDAGSTVVRAFVEAGIFALGAILLLLAITLRRVRDVLLTLLPLLVAAVVTLEMSVVLGLKLNFANIIALPLLLGVGVAFNILTALWPGAAVRRRWCNGTLTCAVIFSAMTTATAFGSMWMSSDPGMSSMGALMALALVCTMAAAVLSRAGRDGAAATAARLDRHPAAPSGADRGCPRGEAAGPGCFERPYRRSPRAARRTRIRAMSNAQSHSPADRAHQRGGPTICEPTSSCWYRPFIRRSPIAVFFGHPFAFDSPPFQWRAFPLSTAGARSASSCLRLAGRVFNDVVLLPVRAVPTA